MSDAPDDAERPRSTPRERHRFVVDADGIEPTGFAAVDGLAVSVDDTGTDGEDDDGWLGWRRRLRRATGLRVEGPDRATTSPPLELRRGVTDDPLLWDWLAAWTDGRARPREVAVYLLDEDGEPAVGWVCSDARPVAWRGPDLRADRPGAAVETLELTHAGIRRDRSVSRSDN